MSITDELRRFIEDPLLGIASQDLHIEMLTKIADHIDVAHKHAIGYVDDRDPETMAENGWVKLPVDFDGVLIHFGDEMENMREDLEPQLHHRFRVYSIHYRDYGQVCVLAEDGYPSILYRADECRHYHEPTMEEVLREFVEKVIDSQIPGVHPTYEEVIAEYAAKLRLADDGEDE